MRIDLVGAGRWQVQGTRKTTIGAYDFNARSVRVRDLHRDVHLDGFHFTPEGTPPLKSQLTKLGG